MRKLLVLLILLILLPLPALAVPNPGHPASQIGAGTFGEEGNYIFPGASRVGINISSPIAALDVRAYSTQGLYVIGRDYPITGVSTDTNAIGYLGYSPGIVRIGVVGIGTTAGGYFSNPSGTSASLATSSYGLDVTGDVRWTGTLQGGSVPWARLTSFPSACPAGQFVTAVNSSLTCSAPPGDISGFGTATQVAFFTGAKTISSDSNLYWDNTNKRLGIGTTNPAEKLHVAGNIRLGDFGKIYPLEPWAGGGGMKFDTTGQWGAVYRFVYRPNGVETTAVEIKDDQLYVKGNVGIGTPTPGEKLDVVGGRIRSVLGGNEGPAILLRNPDKTGSGEGLQWAIYNMRGGYGNSLQFWVYDSLGCVPGGLCTSRLVLTDAGNVGIGTTDPRTKLTISLPNTAGSAGRDAIEITGGNADNYRAILLNKPELRFWSTSENTWADIYARRGTFAGDLNVGGTAYIKPLYWYDTETAEWGPITKSPNAATYYDDPNLSVSISVDRTVNLFISVSGALRYQDGPHNWGGYRITVDGAECSGSFRFHEAPNDLAVGSRYGLHFDTSCIKQVDAGNHTIRLQFSNSDSDPGNLYIGQRNMFVIGFLP